MKGFKTYLAVAAAVLTALADYLGAPPELYVAEGSLVAAFLRAGVKRVENA